MKIFTPFTACVLSAFLLTFSLSAQVDISYLSTFNAPGTEIIAYDANTQRIYSTDGANNQINVFDIADPSNVSLEFSIPLASFGMSITSVDVKNGIVAAAAEDGQNPGMIVFFDLDGNYLSSVTVGALPDMVTFTPDGTKVLSANEGEPNDAYTIDPVGSVSIIDLSAGPANASVTTVSFEGVPLDGPVRIFGPGASVAQDLEPEYIGISDNSQTAYVTLQENNALAVIDIPTASVSLVKSLGFKDHTLAQNRFDASNKDGGINLQTWPTKGMYQPDAIASYQVNGRQYVVTANEGDARDYDGYSEEDRVDDLDLDPTVFPNASELQENENLGRLKTTYANGDIDGDGEYEEIYSYGARSFSIWDGATGELVWDSGDKFETIIRDMYPSEWVDSRSDDKGPEPESVTLTKVNGTWLALIGLERVSGFMVFNVSNPNNPTFLTFVPKTGSDNAPEDILFIEAANSPTGENLIAVAYEKSETISFYNAFSTVNSAIPTMSEWAMFIFGLVMVTLSVVSWYNFSRVSKQNIG